METKNISKTKKIQKRDKPNYDTIRGKEDTSVENHTWEIWDAEDLQEHKLLPK